MAKRKKVKYRKWVPQRFILLFFCIMSPLAGVVWAPLTILLPLVAISWWIEAWRQPGYGYRRNGKVEWNLLRIRKDGVDSYPVSTFACYFILFVSVVLILMFILMTPSI